MTNQLSQTALYGEVLTNEQLYSRDVGEVPYLTIEEEQALIADAKNGCKHACETMITTLLPYVMFVARKYAAICANCGRKRIEYLDLVQVGNFTLVERLEKALAHENPFGYLKRASSGEIVRHCLKHGSLITSPSERGGKILPMKDVGSVNAPVPMAKRNTEAYTLADILVAPEQEVQQEQDFTALYEAVQTLPEKQQYIVMHHYGLECAPEDLFTISCSIRTSEGKPFKDSANEAYGHHKRALIRLQKQLAEVYACA